MEIKRVLFIGSSESDYLEEIILHGLCDILGKANVICSPPRKKYYFSKYPYPKNLGKARGMGLLFHDLLISRKSLSVLEIDVVIVGGTKEDTFCYFEKILDRIPTSTKIIYIDGSDFPGIGGDSIRLGWQSLFKRVMTKCKFDLIFKREYLETDTYPKNVFPLPMAYCGPVIQEPVKQYDVTFWAVESHEVRTKVLEMLSTRYDCAKNGTVQGQTLRRYRRKGHEYLNSLAKSRIALNFRGVGWDTLRYWEIPAVGPLMVSGRPKNIIPDNFIDREHVIFCKDDLSDLADILNYYLKHDKEREEIALLGRKHLVKYHTSLERTRYFLETINSHTYAI